MNDNCRAEIKLHGQTYTCSFVRHDSTDHVAYGAWRIDGATDGRTASYAVRWSDASGVHPQVEVVT